ncbi:MAG: hypothetical protein J2O49_08670 [Sciscionella sp.]|nr:hypothetical protein [Sciscionella sp.]
MSATDPAGLASTTVMTPIGKMWLNRPMRAAVAGGELILAAVAVYFAFVCWRHGFARIVVSDGPPQVITNRYLGNWIGFAIVLVIVAGLALIDAARQLVLAVRAPQRRKETRQLAALRRVEAEEWRLVAEHRSAAQQQAAVERADEFRRRAHGDAPS